MEVWLISRIEGRGVANWASNYTRKNAEFTGHIENKICDNGLYREMGVWLILRKGRGLNIEGWWHISKRVHA